MRLVPSVPLIPALLFCAGFAVNAATLDSKPEDGFKFPLPNPSQIGSEKFSILLNAFLTAGGYAEWKHDPRPHPTGPYTVFDSGEVQSFGTHGPSAVQVYYSPQVWKWLEDGSKGTIADGGMIVKILYARNPNDPTQFSPTLTGFSVMVKDNHASWDGWYYSDGGPATKPERKDSWGFFDPNAGFGLSCINCHASVDNTEGTFSSLRSLQGHPYEHSTMVSPLGLLKGLSESRDIHNPSGDQHPIILKPEARYWPHPAALHAGSKEPAALVYSSYDHVVQGPRPDGQRTFVTASNCMACHDATKLYSSLPNMALKEQTRPGQNTITNLSPYSEWRHSMMGLAGRDPVFYAQLESERAEHPELAGRIDNTCLSCHGVMGQRQMAHDFGPETLFDNQIVQSPPGSPLEKYGALARDGVSCMVCHTLSPNGIGTPATYTGRFELETKPVQVYGPYEKAATVPMEHALGLTPKLGAHISDSKACASCHTVVVPSLDAGRSYSAVEFKELAKRAQDSHGFHEQSSYLEWKNSSYSTEGALRSKNARSCQDCHMPRSYKGQNLKFKVANIEDDTFPPVDHRAPAEQLHLEERDKYSRHALHGINVFVLEMFNQHPWLEGVQRGDNLLPDPEAKAGFDTAIDSMLEMAGQQTARIRILDAARGKDRLIARVQVINLTGHKFPTGVAMRRAFIEFVVKSGDRTIWASGATDSFGVIGTLSEGKFAPLKTESLRNSQLQPHRKRITREDEVQIYEEMAVDSKGDLTTSFLGSKEVVKDNRLLPLGWTASGPDAFTTRPIGTGADEDYQNGKGSHTLTYDIPLELARGRPMSISATLYYQSLPPYYLERRFAHLDKPDTQRLYYLLSTLDRKDTAIKNWKLKIAQDEKAVE